MFKGLIISFSLMFLITYGSYSQEKKQVEIKVKTSAICIQCKERIEQGMAYEKGVRDIVLDVDSKIATITYNPAKTTPVEIRNAISKLGYDADTIAADKDAYAKLPSCCKKNGKTTN